MIFELLRFYGKTKESQISPQILPPFIFTRFSEHKIKSKILPNFCPASLSRDFFYSILNLNSHFSCGLTKEDLQNDFAALTCAQDRPPEQFEAISETCEQVLWRFKLNLTTSSVFLHQIDKACSRDREKLEDCKNTHPGKENAGHFMSCLINQKLEGNLKPGCSDFLSQVEAVIFSDYNLIADFATACQQDIEGQLCGHVRRQMHPNKSEIFYRHSQGLVWECLSKAVDKVKPECKKEILHVAELQSDDYHLDRTLYFDCKRDRESLCPKVQAGEGRILHCLIENKANDLMSDKCKAQLKRRQKLASENFKLNRGLVKACKKEIKAHDCKKRVKNSEAKTVKLAEILLCLEDVMRNEEAEIDGACQNEMKLHRKSLMEDYSISPELVSTCRDDIENSCNTVQGNRHPGEIIHCLLRTAMQRQLESKECEAELRLLLREADIASDWKVDPVLKGACQDVVSQGCDANLGSTHVLSCLMGLMTSQSRYMTSSCKDRLMEIEYFMARDFSLDPQLYQACHQDAQDVCQADDHWYAETDAQNHQLVFACLARNLYDETEENEDSPTLSDVCADEVERVLEQRAISVQLHPEIDEACRTELTQFCLSSTGVGQEFTCLQDNFDNLAEECQGAIRTYTEMEAKNVILNPVIAANCHEHIDKFCTDEVAHKDEGLVIQCLIKHRPEIDDDKCSAALEHWQILSLKDWRFSYQFKESCKNDIRKHCLDRGAPQDKADIITCLSDIARNDVIMETQPRTLTLKCRAQLRFQLLQKHSSIQLNPKVAKNCKKAIKMNCPIGQGNVLECLKSLAHNKMSANCRAVVFEEELEEVLVMGVDHQLLMGCKHEIKSHCPEQNEVNGLLNCLKEAMEEPDFDRGCKMIVNKRVIQHTRDYRLRPRLQKACSMDLKKFCGDVLINVNKDHKDVTKDFLEGAVIQCLQSKFVEDSDLLTPPCKKELEVTVRDEAKDYRANPIILTECPSTIKSCQQELDRAIDNRTSFYGSKIEECLRDSFKKGEILDGEGCTKAIASLIEATNIDIKADHLLYK